MKTGINENLKRKDDESPFVIMKLNWRYHHVGIPTNTGHSKSSSMATKFLEFSSFTPSIAPSPEKAK